MHDQTCREVPLLLARSLHLCAVARYPSGWPIGAADRIERLLCVVDRHDPEPEPGGEPGVPQHDAYTQVASLVQAIDPNPGRWSTESPLQSREGRACVWRLLRVLDARRREHRASSISEASGGLPMIKARRRATALLRLLRPSHHTGRQCPACHGTGAALDTPLESALEREFRLLPLFFSLARELRRHRDLGILRELARAGPPALMSDEDVAAVESLLGPGPGRLPTGEMGSLASRATAAGRRLVEAAGFRSGRLEPADGTLAAALFLDQSLARRIAAAVGEALPFDWVYEKELDHVLASRGSRRVSSPLDDRPGQPVDTRAADAQLVGLAFSGGGIRSATLNLGVLQGLAELGLLRYVDYLSTVSGGGYIGSWFLGWLRREQSLDTVAASLSPAASPEPVSIAGQPIKWLRQYSNYLSPRLGLFSIDTWTAASVWTRNTLLNLLTLVPCLCAVILLPRALGGVVQDLLSTSTRGHMAVVVTGLALLGATALIVRNLPAGPPLGLLRSEAAIRAGVGPAVFVSGFSMAMWLARGPAEALGRHAQRWLAPAPWVPAAGLVGEIWIGVLTCVVLTLLLWALSRKYGSLARSDEPTGDSETPRPGPARPAAHWLPALLGAVVPAAAGGALVVAAARTMGPSSPDLASRPWHLLVVGVPAIVLVYCLVIVLHLGLLGRDVDDQYREWWSRLGALLTTYMLLWCGVCGISIYGPWLLAWLVASAPGWWVASGLTVGWVVTTAAGVLTASSAKTSGRSTGSIREALARLAPAVFVAGLMLLLSFGSHLLLLRFASRFSAERQQTATRAAGEQSGGASRTGGNLTIRYEGGQPPSGTTAATVARLECPKGCVGLSPGRLRDFHFDILAGTPRAPLFIALVVCIGATLLMSWRVDANEFSMHNFYRNRLARCYLGASQRRRRANFFTGFDVDDDFPLSELARADYVGPYPIVNTALNLVKGEELAWQERKAESFVFTPLFSGFSTLASEEVHPQARDRRHGSELCLCGYRPTDRYAAGDPRDRRNRFRAGISTGTAVAISGAAASPNMGFHTSSATAFLMTVFNVRLGWWLRNPRLRRAWREAGPGWNLARLLCELLASTTNRGRFVYLSDGGHFENLGIYELVRRRCRYIIASDAGCDPGFSFEDLGNAVRKCRADFGAEIEIDCGDIRPAAGRGRGDAHCAVGTIAYADGSRGTLLYVKASLTGDEPADVLEYASHHPEFPHQPTLTDQFFDESQFESYRKLGYHAAISVLGDVAGRHGFDRTPEARLAAAGKRRTLDREHFFSDLREYWYASSPRVASSFTRHTEVLTRLMRQLQEDADLAFMDEQISPEWPRLMEGLPPDEACPPFSHGHRLPRTYRERRAGFHFCNSLTQFMENVYLDLALEDEATHPDNSGWINLFRHWSGSAMFRANWAISASCYGSRFRNFCAAKLNLGGPALRTVAAEPAQGDVDDPRLNFREYELLRAEHLFDFRRERPDRLYLLELIVNTLDRRSRPGPPPDGELLRFTFGIAVVDSSDTLVYLRVQDHLRRMGLARLAIDALAQPRPGDSTGRPPACDLRWRPLPPSFPEPVTDDGCRLVERMWEAAQRRRVSAPEPPELSGGNAGAGGQSSGRPKPRPGHVDPSDAEARTGATMAGPRHRS